MNKESLPLEDSPYKLDEHGPIFILGCPRSGTTFLASCMGAMPGMEVFIGVLAPPRLMHLLGYLNDQHTKSQIMLSVRDVFWQSFWQRVLFKTNRMIQFLQRNINLTDLFKKPSLENSLFCYKEPFLCFAAKEFADHFPKAKFIHIIRDGRDNADSLERSYPEALTDEVLSDDILSNNKVSEIGIWRKYKDFNIPWWVKEGSEDDFVNYSKYERYILMWKEMTERARYLKNYLRKSRYLEVKYEEFVLNPIEFGIKIAEFVGTKESERMKKKLRKAFKGSIGIARKNQDRLKIEKAYIIAGRLLEELGYQT